MPQTQNAHLCSPPARASAGAADRLHALPLSPIDETPLPDESPKALVHRLALSTANTVADRFPNHCIIGSDQIALFEGDILGKPHTTERACAHLARFSGQRVTFLTGLALLDTRHQRHQVHIEPFDVVFRMSERD